MKRIIVFVLIGLALAFNPGSSSADMPCGMDKMEGQGHMCGMMGGGMMSGGMMGKGMDGGMMEEMMGGMAAEHRHFIIALSGLDLDEKQKEALAELKSRTMKELIRKKADKQIAGLELKDLLHKDPVDMKAVEAKLKQKEAIETDIHLTVIKAMEEAKSKLTSAQKTEMKEMMGRHMMDGMGVMPCKCHEEMCHGGSAKEEKRPMMEHMH